MLEKRLCVMYYAKCKCPFLLSFFSLCVCCCFLSSLLRFYYSIVPSLFSPLLEFLCENESMMSPLQTPPYTKPFLFSSNFYHS